MPKITNDLDAAESGRLAVSKVDPHGDKHFERSSSDDVIPLSRPFIGRAEEVAVNEVLHSGHLSLGPRVTEFERNFADRLGVNYGCAVSSGTAGLHLALRAVGVQEGDEVITSPFSFVASANSILFQRAKPVFVDIDPVTFNINPDAVQDAITSRTTAILPVHIFGYPADTVTLEKLELPLIEDACEALGAVHSDGVPVGGRGHLAVFGFYPNKQITTGEGGMVVTNIERFKAVIDSERNQGRAPNMDWLDHDRLGFNYRLSDIASAIGIVQLTRLDDLIRGRAKVAEKYRTALQGLVEEFNLSLPCEDKDGNVRSWFVFPVQIPHGISRDKIMERLAQVGIQSKPYMPSIHLLSFYREMFGYLPGQFPICEDVAQRSLALPFFPQMHDWQIEKVATELRSALATSTSKVG